MKIDKWTPEFAWEGLEERMNAIGEEYRRQVFYNRFINYPHADVTSMWKHYKNFKLVVPHKNYKFKSPKDQ